MKQNKNQQIPLPSQVPPSEEKKKKIIQQFQRLAQENKKRWMPFVRFLKKHGLKFKAARCGKVRVQYFRTDELCYLMQEREQQIENSPLLKDLSRLWQKQVIYFERPENQPKLKYPQQLQKSQGNSKSKFASFKFDSAESKTWLFPALLFGIIAVVLFPLWPYMLKYTIFIIALYLVIAIVALIVVRIVIYLFIAIFGVSFWVLPNFFADCSFYESFIPVCSAKRWQGGLFSIIGRLVALSIFAYYAYHLYIDSSWVYQNVQITKASFDDLHDWGVGKIKGQKNFSQSALTNLDLIMNQTAELHVDQPLDLGSEELGTQNQMVDQEVAEDKQGNDQQKGQSEEDVGIDSAQL